MNREEITRNFAVVTLTYKATANESPESTVNAIIRELGVEAATVTIANIVSSIGTWDSRINNSVRHWASVHPEAMTRDQLNNAGIYTPAEIHPAHINQIAMAMMAKGGSQ